jgi:hypothetical protein
MVTRSAILLLLAVAPIQLAAPARAQAVVQSAVRSDPAAAVRGYFAALGRNDFQGALSLTLGAAQERTARMVGTLRQQAAAHRARVELRVKSVEVSPSTAREAGGAVPVDVKFDIDIVGRKWWFSRVARKLAGHAQFYVDDQRIVAIEGKLE